MVERTTPNNLTHRLATSDDVPTLRAIVVEAIDVLQASYLTPEQITSSRAIMGIDGQLVEDGTYFVIDSTVRSSDAAAGASDRLCTGRTPQRRDAALLNPSTEPARVRAMYTDPRFARRGVGRLILSICESAAAAEGSHYLELMATRSGYPLYRAFGFVDVEQITDSTGGAPVPLIRMRKEGTRTTADPQT